MNTQSGQVKRMVLWLNISGFIQDLSGVVFHVQQPGRCFIHRNKEIFIHSVTSIME
jgi:hypothetical protein